MPIPLKNVLRLLQGLKSSIRYCAPLQSGFSAAGEWESQSLYLARCDPLPSYIHNTCKFSFFFFLVMPVTCHLPFARTSLLSIASSVFILPPTPLSLLTVFPPSVYSYFQLCSHLCMQAFLLLPSSQIPCAGPGHLFLAFCIFVLCLVFFSISPPSAVPFLILIFCLLSWEYPL